MDVVVRVSKAEAYINRLPDGQLVERIEQGIGVPRGAVAEEFQIMTIHVPVGGPVYA